VREENDSLVGVNLEPSSFAPICQLCCITSRTYY